MERQGAVTWNDQPEALPLDESGDPEHQAIAALKLGEWLCVEGLITPKQLQHALAHQAEYGGKLGEVLILLGYVERSGFMAFLAEAAGVGTIHLANYVITDEQRGVLPKEFAAQHEIVPISRSRDSLTVAMVYPLDTDALRNVETMTGLEVRPVLCSTEEFWSAYERIYAGAAPTRNA
ncbi:MAG: hypothetical protein IT365_22415 [Candidatus Hydrogenedentes bacterium]|nr:hypothetical protein [Candidatus Hydrogenedentota bacterium]